MIANLYGSVYESWGNVLRERREDNDKDFKI